MCAPNPHIADIFKTDITRTSNRSGLTVGSLRYVVLRRRFGDAREEATGGWRQLAGEDSWLEDLVT